MSTHLQIEARGLNAQQDAFFQSHGLGTLLLSQPERLISPYAWVGHIPFAYALIRLHQPQILVELGTHIGNSFCAFCQAIKHEGIEARCYAVDTWRGDANAGYYDDIVYENLRSYVDSRYGEFAELLKMTFDQALHKIPDGSVDLLHIDGLHTYEAVKHDFETWLVKLSPRAVVLFHDTQVTDRGFGVNKFWSELRQVYDGYEFFHSHGLGVLLVGADVTPAVAEFVALSNQDSDPIQTVFEQASRLALNDEALNYQKRFSCVGRNDNKHSTLYNELFVNRGDGYSEDVKLISLLELNQGCGKEVFELREYAEGLVGVRFDPGDEPIALRKIHVRGRGADGKWRELLLVKKNSIYSTSGFTLFPSDPWMEFAVPQEGLDAIEIDIEVDSLGCDLVKVLIDRMCKFSADEKSMQILQAEAFKIRQDLVDKTELLKSAEELLSDVGCDLDNFNKELRRLTVKPLYRFLVKLRLLPQIVKIMRRK